MDLRKSTQKPYHALLPETCLQRLFDMSAPRAPWCQNDAQMSQNGAEIVQKWCQNGAEKLRPDTPAVSEISQQTLPRTSQKLSKNCAKMVPKRSALTYQLSARSPNKRCQECRVAAPLQPATDRLRRKRTHAHTTRTPHTDMAQQTQHSKHSTAQHNPK